MLLTLEVYLIESDDNIIWKGNDKRRQVLPKLVLNYQFYNFRYIYCMTIGGSGTLAFQLKRTYKDMNVTLFEVPNVIELVKEHFVPGNEDSRIELVQGRYGNYLH